VVLHHSFVVVGIDWKPFYGPWHKDTATRIVIGMFATGNQAYFMGLFFFMAGLVTGPSLKRKGSFSFLKDRFYRLIIPYLLYDYIFFPFMYCFTEATWYGPQRNMTASVGEVWDYYYGNYEKTNGTHMWFTLLLFVFNLIAVILLAIFKSWQNFAFTQQSIEAISPKRMTLILSTTALILVVLNFLPRLGMPDGYKWIYVWGNLGFVMQYCVAFTAGIVANSYRFLDHISKAHLPITLGCSLLSYFPFQVFLIYLPDHFRATIGFHAHIFLVTLFEQVFAAFWSYSLLVLFKEYHNAEPSKTFSALIGAAYATYIAHQYVVVPLAVGLAYASIHPLLVVLVLSLASPPLAWAAGLALKAIPGSSIVL
jgi:glucans biosynthesis protein C